MADLAFRSEEVIPYRLRTDWAAIWAGVFSFVAIWAVFGFLGMAIFASAAGPQAQNASSGMGVGMGIWTIILTIIAMYVAGRETGRLAGVSTRHDGLIHGMIMFGLAVAATLVISGLVENILTGGASGPRSVYSLSNFAGMEWIGFVTLFLGWLAAMFGAASGVSHKGVVAKPARPSEQIRPAA